MQRLPPVTWLLLVAAVAFGWALSWLWRWYRTRRAHKALVAAVTAAGIEYLADVLVPDGMGGHFHVDFLVLTSAGILVVDLRDVRGNIFGGDQMTEWTVMDGPRRTTFTNPQSALYDRVAAVKAVAGDAPVEGRIVFTRNGSFPKGLPKYTLMIDSMRAEFPVVERESVLERFAEGWEKVRSAVTPSRLNHQRVL